MESAGLDDGTVRERGGRAPGLRLARERLAPKRRGEAGAAAGDSQCAGHDAMQQVPRVSLAPRLLPLCFRFAATAAAAVARGQGCSLLGVRDHSLPAPLLACDHSIYSLLDGLNG